MVADLSQSAREAAIAIMEDEDDLILRSLLVSPRAILVRDRGRLSVLALRNGETEDEVSARHRMPVLAHGSSEDLEAERELLECIMDVMES